LVAKLIVDGKTVGAASGGTVGIPIVVFDPFKKPNSSDPQNQGGNRSGSSPSSQPSPSTASPASPPSAAELKDRENPEKVYPRYYSKVEYPSPDGLKDYVPKISFKSLDEKFQDKLLTFSGPSRDAKRREPNGNDPAGGIFMSPRSPISRDADALYGKNTGRLHGATDWLMAPGAPVLAIMTGEIERIGKTETGLSLVQIKAFDGTVARALYVEPLPSIVKGAQVKAGETVIGRAADLSTVKEYAAASVPNHVHVDYTDRNGRRFDPFLNVYIEKDPVVTGAKTPER